MQNRAMIVGFLAVLLARSFGSTGRRAVSQAPATRVVVDSDMTREQALGKNRFPADVLARMEVVVVTYRGFDHRRHRGQIVVDGAIADQVSQIFREIELTDYPIQKVVPIVAYGWNDQASVDDNNTSGFNYRSVLYPDRKTNRLSHHSLGRAIDLNPRLNPFMDLRGHSPRPYDPSRPEPSPFPHR